MAKPSDCVIREVVPFFLPIQTRVPLKFGSETLEEVVCCRVRIRVEDRSGNSGVGWGETPLSVQWVWPSPIPYAERYAALESLCREIAAQLPEAGLDPGHPMEMIHDFQNGWLESRVADQNAANPEYPIPHLAALLCLSAFDIALHDAFANTAGLDVYATYGSDHLNRDLGEFLTAAGDRTDIDFSGKTPSDYLIIDDPPTRLPVWHLVGGLDPLEPGDLTGEEPDDGYPVLLRDWIRSDGLIA